MPGELKLPVPTNSSYLTASVRCFKRHRLCPVSEQWSSVGHILCSLSLSLSLETYTEFVSNLSLNPRVFFIKKKKSTFPISFFCFLNKLHFLISVFPSNCVFPESMNEAECCCCIWGLSSRLFYSLFSWHLCADISYDQKGAWYSDSVFLWAYCNCSFP